MKKLLLIILDGWGVTLKENESVSAIKKAYTPFMNYCIKTYPNSKLNASGIPVGLPKNQMGNSEVGHINLGSGRKIIQSLEKINFSIKNGSFIKKMKFFFSNKNIYKKNIHLIGLLSDGGVHSHMNHLFYLIKLFHEKNIKNVFIHVFTDGRDSSTKKGIFYIHKLLDFTNKYVGKISTVIGRFYSMDRDRKWDRTKLAYDAMVHSKGIYTENILVSIENLYNNNITDEFLKPFIITDKNGNPNSRIKNGDIVFCFNFRPDRSRQLIELLIKYNDNHPKIKDIDSIELDQCITMTCFNKKYEKVIPIFEQIELSNTLGEIFEKEGKKQLRIAETEKYPHVTFFFSGGREKEFNRESRILCPSPKVHTYDLKPEMSAKNIVDQVIPILKKKEFDFICLNFANPDMVGHTGNMKKTVIACEIVDYYSSICSKIALNCSYQVIIVGDHGNADLMINNDGSPNTTHTKSLVPFILLDNKSKKNNFFLKKNGNLSDVAPTILNIMNLPIPYEMTGNSMILKNN